MAIGESTELTAASDGHDVSDADQAEADLLLAWFERRCSPTLAAKIRGRIETDATYRNFVRDVFRQRSMVLWMRDRRRKLERAGSVDTAAVVLQVRADLLARDPLLGLRFPEASTGPIKAIGMYDAPPAEDTDIELDGSPGVGERSNTGREMANPERRIWNAVKATYEQWLATRPSFLFVERRLLPRDLGRQVDICFELLLPLMGPSVAASFFERTIVGEHTGAARLLALRAQRAHDDEGLDGRIAVRLIVAAAEARTRHIRRHDAESQRLDRALSELALEDSAHRIAGPHASESSWELEALLDAQVERDLAIMVGVLEEMGAREIVATMRHE